MRSRARFGIVALVVAALVPALACGSNDSGEHDGRASLAWTNGVPACGAAIGSWGSLTAYSNGACFGNVNCINCDGQGFATHVSSNGKTAYGGAWQCVELITRYYDTTYGIWLSNDAGTPICNTAVKTGGLTVYGPGYSSSAPEPVPGDSLVWNDSAGGGHIALVTAASSSRLDYLEQNWGSPTGYAGTGYTAWGGSNFGAPSDSLGGFSPVCWIHVNANSAKICPQGDGLYCGGHGVGGTVGTLYQCTSGNLTTQATCSLGCQNEPNGTNDQCAPCPNGDGLYCGGNGIPGDASTLYACKAGVVSVSKACPAGCLHEAKATNDQCAPPSPDAGSNADAGGHGGGGAGGGGLVEDGGGAAEAAAPPGDGGGCATAGVRVARGRGAWAWLLVASCLMGCVLRRRRRA